MDTETSDDEDDEADDDNVVHVSVAMDEALGETLAILLIAATSEGETDECGPAT